MSADLLPSPDEAYGCCEASAYTGGEQCTCWEPILDVEPTDALQEGPMRVPRRACHDCAYRAGSPEREAADGALPDYSRDQPFMCHQGVAKVVRFEHPCGAVIVPDGDDYTPTSRGDRVWMADGRPGEYCSGWAAVNSIRRAS